MDGPERRVILVPGASGGLGDPLVQALLAGGDVIVGVARSWKSRPDSERFIGVEMDLGSTKNVETAVARALERVRRIDAVVHVMGGYAGGRQVVETDDATLDRMLDLNLRSAFRVFRAVLPHLQSSGRGRIVAIGSRVAVEPEAQSGAYAVSKAALVALVKTLALEVAGTGVTANIILPSVIDTPHNRAAMPDADFSQWVDPSSIASLIQWLLTPQAKDVNGAVIPIYGQA